MFMKQLVRSLCDENMLFYSSSEGRWQWDLAAIRSMSIPDNAVDLVLERMSHYGLDVQRVLQIASLMGSRFIVASLTLFQLGGCDDNVCGSGAAILNNIDRIVSDGLFCIDKEGELRFAHDSVWEAALALTPSSEREAMSLFVGRSLLKGCSRSHRPDESLDVHFQLIANQMNRGSSLMQSHEERLKVCELNMKAGKTALSIHGFLEASIYLLRGTVLITEKDWNTPTSYGLCLEIFTSSAEAQFAHGHNEAAVVVTALVSCAFSGFMLARHKA